MKNIILFVFLLVTSIINEVTAQEHEDHHTFFRENSVTVSLGAGFNDEVSHLGLNSRFYYNVSENICFGPEMTWFKLSNGNIIETNFVLHYIFETPLVGIYPVVGSNYTKENLETETHDNWNLVFGVGIHRNFRNFGCFAEYTQKRFTHFENIFNLGLMYTIHY
ncbi:hypothetical protein [Marivirga sp.]|uniref:hypothetical protein n=1 Tax=Marivirga sp. TaxID=2018662 RepID=UPI003DA6D558